MAKWLPVTEDFDKSLPIKKWRYDVNNSISGNYDGALSELPNIDIKTCWNNSRPENGYAFSNRFNLGTDYFSNRYYGFTDGKWTATTTSHTTQVEGSIYEFECPVDMYWAGNRTDPWNPAIETMMWFYVDASSLVVDTEEISTTSGGSAYTVNVSADTEVTWTASTSDSWIGLSSPTGTGNGSFTVNIPANPEYAARSGEIVVVSSDEGEATISVSQEKKAVILHRKDMYRNGNLIKEAHLNGSLTYKRINPPSEEPEPPTPPEPVYSAMPLTFEIISGGTIVWRRESNFIGTASEREIEYSINNGPWVSILSTTGGTSFNVSAGDKVRFRGNNSAYGAALMCNILSMTGVFKLYGNIASLIDSTGYTSINTFVDYAFKNLFRGNTGLSEVSDLWIGDNQVNYERANAFSNLFRDCTNLSKVKCTVLPALRQVSYWLDNVSHTGTFVKHPDATWSTGGVGIPEGWTVIDADI